MNELYIGFMSGTSLDGVDASLIRTDGLHKFEALADFHLPYQEEFRSDMRRLLSRPVPFFKLEKQLTEYHKEAAEKLLAQTDFTHADIKAIGFHGQTVMHDPENGITCQIGNPHLLAQSTNIDVVHDFRRRDIALGGEGAPLVPVFHKMLTKKASLTHPVVVLNIGGVANLTYIDNNNDNNDNDNNLIAFDTGMGNALIDDAMMKYFKRPFDSGGAAASAGEVDFSVVAKALAHEYFRKKPPKSADRNEFQFLASEIEKLEPNNAIATLTYITSATIAYAVSILPKKPKSIFLCGGGAKNDQIVKWLKKLLLDLEISSTIETTAHINCDPDYAESQAFAYLAARFFQGVPSTFPKTTGASKESICGCLAARE